MTEKMGILVDAVKGKMKCKVCGKIWYANIRPNSGGKFHRGSWQCPYGCKKRYEMKDVMNELGVAKNTVINWEKSKKIPKAKRDPMSEYRYWTKEDFMKLKKITGRG